MRLASLNWPLSRCEVIRAVLSEHLARDDSDEVTRAMNRVCEDVGVEPEPKLYFARRARFRRSAATARQSSR
jgi:hypothetical protein